MKKLLFVLLLATLFIGCKKDKTRFFTVVASHPDSITATLEIDDVRYPFSEKELQKVISLGEYDVVSVSLESSANMPLSLELLDGGNSMGQVDGSGYIYIIVDHGGISSKSSTYTGGSGGSGGSGSGCATVQCSGTTQSGARCKRMTTNCSGRCWQH